MLVYSGRCGISIAFSASRPQNSRSARRSARRAFFAEQGIYFFIFFLGIIFFFGIDFFIDDFLPLIIFLEPCLGITSLLATGVSDSGGWLKRSCAPALTCGTASAPSPALPPRGWPGSAP